MSRRRPPYYEVTKVYIVVCNHPDCGEEISRSASGEDVYTLAEAEELIAGHEQDFHPQESRP
jgi:hypothetical protein